ncbi:hypothetical protein U1Q18_042544 [Sarracenia purpurea var. burkii]
MNLEVEDKVTKKKMKEDGSSSVVRWERFLRRMVLRVLLVEADDSTRQIVAALLRKCGFRVAAISDGLKAWEILKEKPHNIDLILTEVDLPSISGFALLTLIMEHEICKNIPVIMMSWNDSVGTVYKCMLRGAADFLVKPVRKNELRNLWQHVWRRQASARGGHGPQDESVAQQKVEATAENNAASNHSSGLMACVQRNRECIEKGSDAQSSCTKPDLEAERAYTENVQELSQSQQVKSPASDMEVQNHEECVKSSRNLLRNDGEDSGMVMVACKDANAMTQGEDVATECEREHANIIGDANCNNHIIIVNPAREAIDLIGAFDNHPNMDYRSPYSNNGTNTVDFSPLLDLSLRRSYPSASVNQANDDGRNTLNHSDSSAFSRYVNRVLQPLHSSTTICNQQKDYETSSDRQLSKYTLNHNSDKDGLSLSSQKNVLSLATSPSGQAGSAFACPQRTVFPVQVPVRGVRFDSLSTAYGSAEEPSFQAYTFHPSKLEMRNSVPLHNLTDQNGNTSSNQTEHKQKNNLESSEDHQRHLSSATDQCASSSFCNGSASHFNGNVDQAPVVRAAAESGNKEDVHIQDRNSHRSIQREAALTKFRLKRKDRCYEKKVRYESRKKLAEQRPRVKGQFVRQV